MTGAEGRGVFVSYRRQETGHLAGRLHDRLVARFGESQVFIDVDAIEPGVDFAEEISRAVAGCRVLLAIIGPTWLTATDEHGRRRLDDPDDIVRLEVEAALARGVRVIPILVEGALMPGGQDLPGSLAGLARRNALHMRLETFRHDAERLVAAVEGALAVPGPAAVSSTPDAHGARPGGASGELAQKGSGAAGYPEIRYVVYPVHRDGTLTGAQPRLRHDLGCGHFDWGDGVPLGTPVLATQEQMESLRACKNCVRRRGELS
jgi:hypothetical protein